MLSKSSYPSTASLKGITLSNMKLVGVSIHGSELVCGARVALPELILLFRKKCECFWENRPDGASAHLYPQILTAGRC